MKNKNNAIEMIKRAIKKGDLKEKIVCSILMNMNYSNHDLQFLETRYHFFTQLRKAYSNLGESSVFPERKYESIKDIWICWFQGIESAPELVKICLNSVYAYMSDMNIHLITKVNFSQYVEIPTHILEKWNKGIITNTHFSDILRAELLIKHGGIWMDATVLLTDRIPDYMTEQNMFFFTHSNILDRTINTASWFIVSQKNNPVLIMARDGLYDYWMHRNKLKDYFLFHDFVTLAFEKCKDDWEQMYHLPDNNPHILVRTFDRDYDETYWNEIKKITTIHKLNYKNEYGGSNTSFYHMLLEGKLK